MVADLADRREEGTANAVASNEQAPLDACGCTCRMIRANEWDAPV